MLTEISRLSLPAAFNHEANSEDELVGHLRGLRRPVEDLSFADRSRRQSRVTGIRIGHVVLHECLSEAVVSKTLIDPNPSFLIALTGGTKILEQGRSLDLHPLTDITVMSALQPKELTSRQFHLLGIRPELDELTRAVSSILGDRSEPDRITQPDRTSFYPGRIGDNDYIQQILALVSVVNGTDGDLSLLNRIGIADIFTKVLAEFLVGSIKDPGVLAPSRKSTRSMSAVDVICSYIEDNVGHPLTIVKMEQMTGMTGRSLNYAFQDRYNCSPQQWQRRYLLDKARARLLNRDDLTSVKALAFEFGFASSSSFTAHYSRRFGEKPSETRAAAAQSRRTHAPITEND